MKALIVKQPWVDYILDGKKVWEIRGSNTKIRGRIALIQSGSGLVVGECDLVDCLALDKKSFQENRKQHQIPNIEQMPYKNTFAWVLANAVRYQQPRPYRHPCGAVIWVNLKSINENS